MRRFTRYYFLGLILTCCIAASCSGSDDPVDPGRDLGPAPDPVELQIPPGFPTMHMPTDNPLTRQGIDLGRRLYYDPILSADSTQSCASCHQFGRAFSDTAAFSAGITGDLGARNAPAIINPGWLTTTFWDGREPSLEDQARQPVKNPIEMASDWDDVVEKLQSHPEYPELFKAAFRTDEVSEDRVVKAIAQFERTMISAGTKYDAYLADPNTPLLSDQERRGADLFFNEIGDCFHCHGNAFGTDHSFRNIGLDETLQDLGLGEITGRPQDMGKFKVPTLRNVEFTAPYMHDGRFETLHEVVNHYNTGGFPGATVDPLIRTGVGLGMTPQQVDDIVAFLLTFSDPDYLTDPDLSNPFEE